jgi:hypothetical protein
MLMSILLATIIIANDEKCYQRARERHKSSENDTKPREATDNARLSAEVHHAHGVNP